ncbi:MAG TPA: hypothetical protein GXZ22_01025, partial [Clostridiaceae bacterium]|nr:hypothetical protein [Clostridiaceae bacterium]
DSFNADVEKLTVDTDSISGCSIGVLQNGSWVYQSKKIDGSTTSFDVFDNGKSYEVRISKGGMSVYLDGEAGETVKADVKQLTVDTDPISDCSIGVLQNGSWVYQSKKIDGSTTSFDVFDNDKEYEVRISKGGMSIYLDGEAGEDLTVPTYALKVPAGWSNVGLVQNGSWVYQNITSPSTIYVFNNGQPAEFRYKVGGNSYTDTFLLDGKSGTDLTVDYTGLYNAPHTYLYDATGRQVGYSGSTNQAVFRNLPAGDYTIKLHKNGLIKEYNVFVKFSDFSAGKTFAIPLVNLTVEQPGGVNYYCNINVSPVNGLGNIAYSQSGAEIVTGMKLFPNESYRISFNNGMNFTDTFTVGETDYTYTVPYEIVGFDTTGIPYGYGMSLTVTNTSNGATAQYKQFTPNSQVDTALIIGNTYNATLRAGSMTLYSGTFTVDGPKAGTADIYSITLTNPVNNKTSVISGNPPVIKFGNGLFINTGIADCKVGIIYKGSWYYTSRVINGTFAYFPADPGTYEVRISKGGMTYTTNLQTGTMLNVPVKKLTVDTGAVSDCTIGVVQNGSWVYQSKKIDGSTTSFDVFDNGKPYEVRISKGGMSIYLDGEAGDTVKPDVKQLTVDTGAVSDCTIGVVQNGSWVYQSKKIDGSTTSFDVFANDKPYEVRISKGGMSIIKKATDSVTVETYAINIPEGLKNVGLVQNGSWVYTNITSPSTIYVFKNDMPAEFRYTSDGVSKKVSFTMDGTSPTF